MDTREEWNNVYFAAMAIASVAVGTLGVTIGLLSLKRSQAEAAGVGVNIPKVRYDNGEVLVQVRNIGEWHDIREFVQPLNPAIVRVVDG